MHSETQSDAIRRSAVVSAATCDTGGGEGGSGGDGGDRRRASA